jgi:hypothetical protein
MSLQRLIITLKPEEIVMLAHYRTQDGPGPNTKTKALEVAELARTGLEQTLKALEGGTEGVGTPGFTTREDVLLTITSPSEAKLMKRA